MLTNKVASHFNSYHKVTDEQFGTYNTPSRRIKTEPELIKKACE